MQKSSTSTAVLSTSTIWRMGIAIAGPKGAGETTFYHVHIARARLPLVNADRLAIEQGGHDVPQANRSDRDLQ